MRVLKAMCVVVVTAAMAAPAYAQFGSLLGKIQDKAQKAKHAKDTYTAWTPEQEEQVGEASAARLINVFGLYDNPEMVRYVNLVGDTVAQQATRQVPYRFGILDTEIITAVSLPGGYVFITRGALANMTSEAELAGTLAHEVAHVDQRHLEKEVRAGEQRQMIKDETAQFTTTRLTQLASSSLNTALTQQYSRDKETDADRLGVMFAQKAGYNPDGLRLFLTFLSQAPTTAETKRQLSLWGSTHPPFPERIATLQTEESNLPSGGQMLEARFARHVNATAFAPPPKP